MQAQRICQQCGSQFTVTSKHPHQANCSRQCGYAAKTARARIEKPCAHCGTMFVTKRGEVERGRGLYCSRACSDAERPGPTPELRELLRQRKGASNPAFRGTAAGIAAAHDRVRAAKGHARDHLCVECGDPALDWALSKDAETIYEAKTKNMGRLYSLNVDDYMPMCRRCHVHYDHDGVFPRHFGANAGWAV